MVVAQTPRRVVSVLDWAIVVAALFAIVSLAIVPPIGGLWVVAIYVAILAGTALVALSGLHGKCPWRHRTYPYVALASGVLALWTHGPLGGIGIVLAAAVLLASVFGSRRLVLVVVTLALLALALRGVLATGLWDDPDPTVLVLDHLRMWIRIMLVTAGVMWVAVRVLEEVSGSLEEALDRTDSAYRAELAMQVELDVRRQELGALEEVELVGRLAGGVAHDVNNALTIIMATSEVISDDVKTDHQRECLAELETASQKAAELVRDLLWIGRKFPPTTHVADLHVTLGRCIARLRRMSRLVTIEPGPVDVVRVALAPERLEQVLFWTVVEAERAGIRVLTVTARRDGSEVVVELAAREAITAAQPDGLAAKHAELTASASRDVIEQAGGLIKITGAGVETHIELRIPAVDEGADASEPIAAAGSRALVVEDEPLVLERLARLVAARGYRVITATSLAEAWPKLDAGCDLLVTDLQLGDGRGDGLAIASFERTPERPIVICSGFGADDALRDRLRGARLVFLTKPFTRVELEVAIPQASVVTR